MIHQKIGVIGAGSMGRSVIERLLSEGTVKARQMYVSNRSAKKLQKISEDFSVNIVNSNEELIENCDVIFLAVKPQDLLEMLEPLTSSFHESHILISLAAGISIDSLLNVMTETNRIVRAMPNTPISIGKGVIGYSIAKGGDSIKPLVEDLLEPMGYSVFVDDEEMFSALTVGGGSGPGFVFELIQYWQEWLEEYGFSPEVSRKITVQTFLGTTLLAEKSGDIPISDLQNKVVSKKGVTHAGLESMRSLEVDQALRVSFEKALLRDKELGREGN